MSTYHLSYADWSGKEYAAALRCLLSGKVSAGDHIGRLVHRLEKHYTPSTIYPVNYGRNAIHIALQAFHRKKPEGTEIIVPAYICPSVTDAITHAGFTPVFADISDDLNLDPYAMAAAITSRTLAVIAPHMYGCPARIEWIEKLCRDAGVFLIDDAAQVMGVSQGGRPLGTFGDMGIVSFAQSKAVVTGIRGSGGVLLVNNSDFDADARSVWLGLPPPSRRLGAFLDFLWNYIWSAHTGTTGYYLSRIRKSFGRRSQNGATMSRISNLEAAIALEQIDRLSQMQQNRLQVIDAYHAALKSCEKIAFPQYAAGRYLARIMLLLPEDCDASLLVAPLKKAGVNTRLGYAPANLSTSASGLAQSMSPRLIGVPCGTNISKAEASEICSILISTLNSVLSK